MQNKLISTLCLTLLVMGTFTALVGVGKGEAMAAVYVDPPEVTGLTIGDSFTINVNVASVTNLAGWEFQLFYLSQVLNVTKAEEGSFLKSVGGTFYLPYSVDDHYNSTHGRVYLVCTTLPVVGVSGGGVLAVISFQIVGAGYSALTLPENATKLLEGTLPPQRIPHTVANGLVVVVGADVAITGLHLSKTIVNSTQVIINVTAANLGNFTASFNVTVYYDSTEIGTQIVTDLAPSTSLVLSFMWDTAPVPKGNYTMSGYAPPIIGENNAENNRLIDGWVVVTILGDVTGDGLVNILDIFVVANAFGSKLGDAKYEPNADFDDSGEINILDIFKVAKEFGKEDP